MLVSWIFLIVAVHNSPNMIESASHIDTDITILLVGDDIVDAYYAEVVYAEDSSTYGG